MMRLEIVSDPNAMTVTVGERVFAEPVLTRLAEKDCSIRREILPNAPWDDGASAAYKYYAAHLGAKFNRRFQAANYWLWVGNKVTQRTANMLRREGKHWKQYHGGLVKRANDALAIINEAERDQLFTLVPIIAATGDRPEEIRRQIGKGAWRRLANNSLSRNCRIMHAIERARHTTEKYSPNVLVRLLDIPSGVMRAVWGATDYEMVAARITPLKRAAEFQQTVHFVQDTHRMLGTAFNPDWSYARMVREHNAASRDSYRKYYSDKPFCEPWAFVADGFKGELLTTELDIAAEGSAQHHCVASYAKHAARGQYAVFRIEGKERATAGMVIPGGRIDQVYGACNRLVAEACRDFAHHLAAEYVRATSTMARVA